MSFKLVSFAFTNEDLIPARYSHKGGNVSPPLAWMDAPQGTRSLALIVDDPDAPSGLFVHWLMYAIPPDIEDVEEDQPASETLSGGIRQGRNGFGEIGYGGPQPPSGVHRYFFHLYALDTEIDLPPGATREQLDRAMQGHVVKETVLMGRYEEAQNQEGIDARTLRSGRPL